ncbi:pVIII [Polar bear adenovirus 1]|uniref:PVIII n=1 Tax=Polar bear adenovirus 1 TaxID=2250215 RepID=A0A2Z4QJG6_9ADEN|nr:pVIII [Polar bear adenovirus 1]
MNAVPTPYIWSYQPQLGIRSGASQDYSTRINWLGAGDQTVTKIRRLNDERNRILMEQSRLTDIPIYKPPAMAFFKHLDQVPKKQDNATLSVGIPTTPYFPTLKASGLTLNENSGKLIPALPSEGTFQLAGGNESDDEMLINDRQVLEQSLDPQRFLRHLAPEIYFHPFSGAPGDFPRQYIFNFNFDKNAVDGYN